MDSRTPHQILRIQAQIAVAQLMPEIADQNANRPAIMSDSGTPAYYGDQVENGPILAHAPTESAGPAAST